MALPLQIPENIEKEIDQVKPNSAGIKLALKLLIIAVMALAGVIVWQNKSGTKSNEVQLGIYKAQVASLQAENDKKDTLMNGCTTEVARLNNYIITQSNEELKRERENDAKRTEMFDKIKTLIK